MLRNGCSGWRNECGCGPFKKVLERLGAYAVALRSCRNFLVGNREKYWRSRATESLACRISVQHCVWAAFGVRSSHAPTFPGASSWVIRLT